MKRTLVALILGVVTTASVTSSYAQGKINLDTYNTSPFPIVSYGAGSGGTVGQGVNNSFTVGLYYALGTVAVAADPTGIANPATLGALTLGTGAGSAAGIVTGGWFSTPTDFQIPSYVSGPVTLVMIAYNGSSYDTSGVRGHSIGFQITPSQSPVALSPGVGSVMPTFAVLPVPEPATFVLGALGTAALLLFRRRS